MIQFGLSNNNPLSANKNVQSNKFKKVTLFQQADSKPPAE